MSELDKKWPFNAWLKIAVLQMGLSPAEFWQIRLRDWLCLCQPMSQSGFSRGDFEDLTRDFPDQISEHSEE